jgi:hypothetical protein
METTTMKASRWALLWFVVTVATTHAQADSYGVASLSLMIAGAASAEERLVD